MGVPRVQDFFKAKHGDRSALCILLDDTAAKDILREEFPCLFTLARNHEAKV